MTPQQNMASLLRQQVVDQQQKQKHISAANTAGLPMPYMYMPQYHVHQQQQPAPEPNQGTQKKAINDVLSTLIDEGQK